MTDQPPARSVRYPTDEEVKAEFEAYTCAVGKVAHAWNYLHEKLGALFAHLVDAPDRNVIAAVWYSAYSDRAQRQMLEASIVALAEYRWQSVPDHAKADLIWLLRRVDELGNKRDDAIHAPAILQTDFEKTEMATSFLSGHRRAKNLVGKQLLVEFDWIERYTEELSRFIQQATNALAYAGSPWPSKPRVPDRRPKKSLLSPALRRPVPK
jgi:hypothetical protein